MIRAVAGPLIVQPEFWTLVFNREAATWWASWLALGRYKHVRAYAYVPFLHVWVFYDVNLSGTDIVITADGEPSRRMIAEWTENADLLQMKRQCRGNAMTLPPVGAWCVPAMKRLLGLQCVAARPDAFYRYCRRNGGVPFEAVDGRSKS